MRRFNLSILPLLMVLLAFNALAPQFASAAQYVYDPNGRLTSVIESDGSSITYAYDTNGNITSIVRTGVTMPLTVTSFFPASGPIGTLVTIRGDGFNPNIAQNAVTFNGV